MSLKWINVYTVQETLWETACVGASAAIVVPVTRMIMNMFRLTLQYNKFCSIFSRAC